MTKRRMVAALAGLALGLGALECASGVAPKSQCHDGSVKGHGEKVYVCHNGEWTRKSK